MKNWHCKLWPCFPIVILELFTYSPLYTYIWLSLSCFLCTTNATILFSVHNKLSLSYFLYTTNCQYPVFCHIIATILFSDILLPISYFLYTTNCHYPVFCHIITTILFSVILLPLLFSVILLPLSCFLSYYWHYPVFCNFIVTILFSFILLALSCFLS